jgi:hypothetical protein
MTALLLPFTPPNAFDTIMYSLERDEMDSFAALICFRVQCLAKFFLAFFQMAQLLMIEGYANSDWPMFVERHKLKSMNQSEFA